MEKDAISRDRSSGQDIPRFHRREPFSLSKFLHPITVSLVIPYPSSEHFHPLCNLDSLPFLSSPLAPNAIIRHPPWSMSSTILVSRARSGASSCERVHVYTHTHAHMYLYVHVRKYATASRVSIKLLLISRLHMSMLAVSHDHPSDDCGSLPWIFRRNVYLWRLAHLVHTGCRKHTSSWVKPKNNDTFFRNISILNTSIRIIQL